MKTKMLKKEILIPETIHATWAFFSDPQNLKLLTPAYMDFHIIHCPENTPIYDGMLVEYKVSPLLHLPLNWITRIESVTVNKQFKDIQLQGPFTSWEHIHTFEQIDNGTFMTDTVKYVPPLGVLGQLANNLFLGRQLQGIFAYREKIIKKTYRQ